MKKYPINIDKFLKCCYNPVFDSFETIKLQKP